MKFTEYLKSEFMLKKFYKYIAFLAALATCLTFITNLDVVLNVIKEKWPEIGDWLTPAAIIILSIFITIYSFGFLYSIVHKINFNRISKRLLEESGVRTKLREIIDAAGSFRMDDTQIARIEVIFNKLVKEGYIHARYRELQQRQIVRYLATIDAIIEEYGLEYVKENSMSLIEQHITQKNKDC